MSLWPRCPNPQKHNSKWKNSEVQDVLIEECQVLNAGVAVEIKVWPAAVFLWSREVIYRSTDKIISYIKYIFFLEMNTSSSPIITPKIRSKSFMSTRGFQLYCLKTTATNTWRNSPRLVCGRHQVGSSRGGYVRRIRVKGLEAKPFKVQRSKRTCFRIAKKNNRIVEWGFWNLLDI